jgi:hypothetical protein
LIINAPQPTLTEDLTTTPQDPVAGSSFSIDIKGTNFTTNTQVIVRSLGGSNDFTVTPLAPLPNAGTEKLFTMKASAPGAYQLSLTNPGGSALDPKGFNTIIEVNGPTPTITGLSPSSIGPFDPPVVLTVSGTNFVPGAQVLLNGSKGLQPFDVSTDGTSLKVNLAGADLAGLSDPIFLTVKSPAPFLGNGLSNAWPLNRASATPVITGLGQLSAPVGSPAFNLTINGRQFAPNATAQWNGTSLTLVSVTPTQIVAGIPAALLATAGPATIIVANPTSSGPPLQSNSATFTVGASGLTLGTATAHVGDPDLHDSLSGGPFASGSVVLWNGQALQTTPGSDVNTLNFTIPSALLATAGTAAITVSTTSAAPATFTVLNYTPFWGYVVPQPPIYAGRDYTLALNQLIHWTDSTTVTVQGTPLQTTRVGTDEVDVTIPAELIPVPPADGSSVEIDYTVANPSPSDPPKTNFLIEIWIPPPTVDSISVSPAAPLAGTDGFSVLVRGSDFLDGVSTVTMDTLGYLPTTFVSATELIADVPDGYGYLPAGTHMVRVHNANNSTPGGGDSNELPFTVDNPVPEITDLDPTWIRTDSGPVSITVNGTGFITETTYVEWDGRQITPSNALSGNPFIFGLQPANFANPGFHTLNLVNPGPGGGASNTFQFLVVNALPVITGINPEPVPAGGPDTTITVTGNNFLDGAVVEVNGTALPTTFDSATKALTTTLPAALLASPTTLNLAILNADGQLGDTSQLSVALLFPSVDTITPERAVAGSGPVTLTVVGSDFLSTTKVRWDGQVLPTTYVSTQQLTATVSAADLAQVGTFLIDASDDPAIDPYTPPNCLRPFCTSRYVPFFVDPQPNPPAPELTGLTPGTAPARSVPAGGTFTLTITGTNFVPGSVSVQWGDGGSIYPATAVSTTEVDADLPANVLNVPGTYQVRLVSPDGQPLTGTNALPFVVTVPDSSPGGPSPGGPSAGPDNPMEPSAPLEGDISNLLRIQPVNPVRKGSKGSARAASRGQVTLMIRNTSGRALPAFRLVLGGLARGFKLSNSTGTTTTGAPFVQVRALASGESLQVVLRFRSKKNRSPQFTTQAVV